MGIIFGTAYNTQVKQDNKIAPVSFAYYNVFAPYIGLIYRDSLSKRFSIKCALYYAQRGTRFHYHYETYDYVLDVKTRFNAYYVSFPVKLYYSYKKLFIGAGLEASILIKGHIYQHIEETIPSRGYQNFTTLDYWSGSKSFYAIDGGFNLSFGYHFKNNIDFEFSMFHGVQPPPKFTYFSHQHFEFKYAYQETFMLGIHYFPMLKKRLQKTK